MTLVTKMINEFAIPSSLINAFTTNTVGSPINLLIDNNSESVDDPMGVNQPDTGTTSYTTTSLMDTTMDTTMDATMGTTMDTDTDTAAANTSSTNFENFKFAKWTAAMDEMEKITRKDWAKREKSDIQIVVEAIKAQPQRVKCPKLTKTTEVYKWIAGVTTFTKISMDYDLTSSHDTLCNMIQNAIEIGKDDPLMDEFSEKIQKHKLPGNRKVLVKLPGLGIPTAKGPVRTNFIKKIWEATPIEEDRGSAEDDDDDELDELDGYLGPQTTVRRPISAWEWLQEFVEKIWITNQRRESYKRLLKDLRFVPGPKAEGIMINLSKLEKHFTNCKDLLDLAQVKDSESRITYLKDTFVGDIDLYGRIVNTFDWTKMEQQIRGQLEARIMTEAAGNEGRAEVGAIRVEGNQAANQNGQQNRRNNFRIRPIRRNRPFDQAPYRQFENRQPERRFDWNRVGYPDRRMDNRNYDYQGPRENRFQRRDDYRPQNGSRARATKDTRLCYWCGREGHRKIDCRDKRDGKKCRIPSCPSGEDWAEHVRKCVKEGKLL